jgi:hypothetical protein
MVICARVYRHYVCWGIDRSADRQLGASRLYFFEKWTCYIQKMNLSPDFWSGKVSFWCEHHKEVLLYDAESSTLFDVASGKSLYLQWSDVTAFEEKAHPETNETYLVLMFENGTQIALVDPGGVAFAPSTEHSGPVQNLPPVVCLRDFYTLKQRVDHYLHDHPEDPPPRECLDLIMICIATLDGARAVGFDVADLEGELEKSLTELERRTG